MSGQRPVLRSGLRSRNRLTDAGVEISVAATEAVIEPSPLAVPATPQRLRALREAKVLSDATLARALEFALGPPPREAQSAFAARAALIVGGLLSLASIVFFVAHNWGGMSRWAKFGVLEVGLLAFAAAAWRAKGQLTRQVAMTSCAAMLGPLLAVYGQTYQTGADPYELFLSWALLAAPIAALSRFVPLWIGVWALLNVSLSLWCHQMYPFGSNPWQYDGVVACGLNAAGLGAYELVSRRTDWLGARAHWPARALAVAALLSALPLACSHLWRSAWYGAGFWGAIATAATTALCTALCVAYRRDAFMRSTAAFGACGLAAALAGNVICDYLADRWAAVVLGLIVVLEITLAAAWIRRAEVKA